MRFERRGDGAEILVQDGEHVLIADAGGDPACSCGIKPSPPIATSQMHAVAIINEHIRARSTEEGADR